MFEYNSATGQFSFDSSQWAVGYSGCGEGRNNQTLEWKPNVGPIPRGLYKLSMSYNSHATGPLTFALIPVDHDACGRSQFRIHGDNKDHTASHGCIVLDHETRERIEESSCRLLRVV